MIDIHVRISRKLVIFLVIVFVVLPLVWLALQTLGGSSGKTQSLNDLTAVVAAS
jgi:hypothetical protein